MEYQYQTVTAQLFASPVATTILGSALQEVCHSRMVFCRDLLILLCVMKYSRISEVRVIMELGVAVSCDYHVINFRFHPL